MDPTASVSMQVSVCRWVILEIPYVVTQCKEYYMFAPRNVEYVCVATCLSSSLSTLIHKPLPPQRRRKGKWSGENFSSLFSVIAESHVTREPIQLVQAYSN